MLLFLLLFAPACAAALLYDKCSPGERPAFRLALTTAGFALVTNMLAYAVFWLRGNDVIDLEANLASVPFCLKYMGLSLLIACLLAAAATGLAYLQHYAKAGKKNG